jgi:hypothetical protein
LGDALEDATGDALTRRVYAKRLYYL